MSNLLAAIRARDSAVFDVAVEVTGALAEAPARFTGINLLVTAETADGEVLDKLLEIADRGCIMMNTLRDKLDISIRSAVRRSASVTRV